MDFLVRVSVRGLRGVRVGALVISQVMKIRPPLPPAILLPETPARYLSENGTAPEHILGGASAIAFSPDLIYRPVVYTLLILSPSGL